MKQQFLLATFLLLTAASFSISQVPPRDPTQIRNDVAARNQAIDDYDRRNPNGMNVSTILNGRMLSGGKIPGSAIRSYVLAAQVQTEVKVLKVASGDLLLVDDGVNKVLVRIIGINAPENGQNFFEESKTNLSGLVLNKKVVLKYSLHNLKDESGYFPARVFIDHKDIGLDALQNGFAWYYEKDKFFFEKKDVKENADAQMKAQTAKAGLWKEEKPLPPWEYREQKLKEAKKIKKPGAKT